MKVIRLEVVKEEAEDGKVQNREQISTDKNNANRNSDPPPPPPPQPQPQPQPQPEQKYKIQNPSLQTVIQSKATCR